jgi:cellulose biosynthesis protein BcsQ
MKSIVFFNNKGGVGKTTMVYHTAHMLANLGKRVLLADLDPQTNLTAMSLSDEAIESVYNGFQMNLFNINSNENKTIISALKNLLKGIGDIAEITPIELKENLYFIPGDLELSFIEDKLSTAWNACLNSDEAAFRLISSIHRTLIESAYQINAEYILIDIGPNFGALNRIVLTSSDYVIIPMGADLFSIQGLSNIGRKVKDWEKEWKDRLERKPKDIDFEIHEGLIKFLGYVVLQHGIRERRPVKAYQNWANKIPETYQRFIQKIEEIKPVTVEEDENCLALIKHYRSLAPMAMNANKPIFELKPADGAIGAHGQAVRMVYEDFEALSNKIIELT